MRLAGTLNHILDLMREVLREATILWWRFFDWVAVVEWRRLYVVWIIVFVGMSLLHTETPALWFIFVSASVKVLAGGKRKAELMAASAQQQADVEALERKVVESEMATLQAQVEPHFLFNTLALIGQLIETDPPEAARIHQYLIDYLRATLPQMRNGGRATLGKQVELSRAYLSIMQARMKERLQVRIDVPEHLNSAPFPPMMLVTLIENAIKHGLEPKIEGGTVEVAARVLYNQARIVFVTAYDQYAIDAFEQGAIDYLLKPVTAERLALTRKRLEPRLRQPPEDIGARLDELTRLLREGPPSAQKPAYLKWIQAQVGNSLRMISTREVLYFQADEKYTRVQTASAELLIRKTLKELCDELDPDEFWRIHRSTLVRVDAIAEVTRDARGRQLLHLRGVEEPLEISRGHAHLFQQM
jgi:DNA-binding LytR/AlgR family response regulator